MTTERRIAAPAPPARRLAATAIDLVPMIAVAVIAAVAIGDADLGFWVVVVIVNAWITLMALDQWRHGRTPGKRLLGLRVQRRDGARLSWNRAMLRTLLLACDFGIALLFDHRDERVGDMVAGTTVVAARGGEKILDYAPPIPGTGALAAAQRAAWQQPASIPGGVYAPGWAAATPAWPQGPHQPAGPAQPSQPWQAGPGPAGGLPAPPPRGGR